MAVPVWPVAVPHTSEADGASATQSYQAPLSSETEAGIPIMRRRPGPRVTEFSWKSIPLTDDQWVAFEAFTREDLLDGTLVFDMQVFKPGVGYVARKCQIKDGAITNDFSVVPYVRAQFTLIIYNW